jgi:TonB family protein
MKFLITAVVFCATAAPVAAQTALDAARDLYAAAAYEDALSELARVHDSSSVAPETAVEMDEYRAFCLFALGRTGEAETAAESVIRRDPLVQLDHRDASPRVDAMFTAVRKRVLPQLIRDEYRSARSLVTAKSPDAVAHLERVNRLLHQAETLGASDDTLADLGTLVDGFIELARANDAPHTAAARPDGRAATQPAPDTSAEKNAHATHETPTSATRALPDIHPPVTLSQAPPRAPAALLDILRTSGHTGAYDIVIDEAGSVREVRVRESLNAAYDNLVQIAARNWKYRPATNNGVPVTFVKTIVLNPGQND